VNIDFAKADMSRMRENIPREPGQLLYLSFDPAHAHVLKD
jgi:hypothetical protein